ncbi:MAG: flagella basal body P-ring formation protein FlgA, partial [Gemmatimonadetes bacterium]|nr:flagella basal body P-ring formation protein FlgA [Gemmatimonadota bacterium]
MSRPLRSSRAFWLAAAGAALALLLAVAPVVRAQAAPRWTPPRAVSAAARREIAARWGVDTAAVRLEWTPPVAALPAGAATARLGGSGAGGYWTVSVPAAGGTTVDVRVRAGIEARVPTAARDLPRGRVLEAGDLAPGGVVRWGPPAKEAAGAEPGWVTRRVVAAGEPLVEPAASPPPLVAAGDTVRVRAGSGAVEVQLRGVALQAGRL